MKSAVRTTWPVDQADRGVVWLDDPRARAPGLAGAKAAALSTARAAGLAVLPGIVVTTTFDDRSAEHRAALRDAWSSISHAGELSLVVRSSSTIEDTAASSMAGMFTSVLDVCGWEQFEAAIDSVLASSNVVLLGEGRDGDGRSATAPMAVLVQPYVTSTSGGVLFGLDPVSGRPDRLVVSATDRGPAALVSGEVDGSRYVLTRWGRLVEGPVGGAGSGLLGRSQLRELAAVARGAERLFGGPQDIEWAFDEAGAFRLLQSRPVTARGDAAVAHGPVFGPGPIAETFPEPLSPLEEDLWAGPLRDGLRHALGLAGTVARRQLASSPVVVSVQGRLALNLDVMPGAARRSSLMSRLDPRPPLRRLVAAWRVGRLRAALPALAADLLAKADEDLLAVDAPSQLTDRELLGLLGNARQGLTALHGHEVLMGWLVHSPEASVTAASVALRLLAEGRAAGLSDEEIVARDPGVLALTAPRIAPETELPLIADGFAPGSGAGLTISADDPALLREALRLRARWVQELTARAAWELGRRLASRGVITSAEQVRLLGLDELETAVRAGVAPADIATRRQPLSAPLPARFRLTLRGSVVAVRTGRNTITGAQGGGGGRGVGVVHGETATVPERAILVVRTLDPALAPVLPRLAGLVAETGSVLSHLAILAREFGVPTVVGVDGATDRFPPGSLVVVDGTTGEVELVGAERGAA